MHEQDRRSVSHASFDNVQLTRGHINGPLADLDVGGGRITSDPRHADKRASAHRHDSGRRSLRIRYATARNAIGPPLRSWSTAVAVAVAVAAGRRSSGPQAPRFGDEFTSFIDLDCFQADQDDWLPVVMGGREELPPICREQRILGLERLDPDDQRLGVLPDPCEHAWRGPP